MVYNVDFLISAICFLTLILYHFLWQRQMGGCNNKVFLFALVVGLLDMVMDIVCTVLIAMPSIRLRELLRVSLAVLYLLQALTPFSFYIYIHRLRNLTDAQWRNRVIAAAAVCIPVTVLVLANRSTGWLFTVTADGHYLRGPLYLVMYLQAVGYGCAVAVDSILYHKQFGHRTVAAIWEFLVLSVSGAVYQMLHNDILMSSFGLALGITVLFLTINNPYAYTDSLTGVYDQRYFLEFLQPVVARKRRALHCVAVDVSCLRRINRMYGVEAGNSLQRQVATLLRSHISGKWVFRIGGSQFLALVTDIREYEELFLAAEKFSRQTVRLGADEASIALSVCGIHGCESLGSCEAILAYIEYLNSLRPDKETSFSIQSSAETRQGFHYEQLVESFLPTAIREDLFTVQFQPVYAIRDGSFISLEALSRLRHPEYGFISPQIFVSVAERANCMTQIGLLQLKRICAFVREHRQELKGIKSVKINLSPSELLNVQHCRQMIQVIRDSGVDPAFLEMEITESMATEYKESLYRIIEEFTEAGIRFCMDDFGSGYANLNSVLRIPFSVIKLDRSMLMDICSKERNATLYAGIVGVLRGLGYQTVAEGVETKEELEMVTAIGVDMIQGYYFSKPLDCEKLLERLKNNG